MAKFSDDRIRSIIEGPRAFRVYEFPGAEGVEVAVRCLTEAEVDSCRVAAQTHVREQAKKRGWKPEAMVEIDPHCFDRAIERAVVWRSMFDSETISGDDPGRFFDSPKDVATLDSVTLTTLSSLYIEHQEWVSPLALLPQEEVDELVESMGKGPAASVFLGRCAPSTLRHFVISLASALRSGS